MLLYLGVLDRCAYRCHLKTQDFKHCTLYLARESTYIHVDIRQFFKCSNMFEDSYVALIELPTCTYVDLENFLCVWIDR